MTDITQSRCFHHAGREAVARCPQCARTFCRECITEHEGRVICAGCLQQLTAPEGRGARRFRWMGRALGVATCLLLAWLFFYGIGRALLAVPESFHEGTVWEDSW